MTKFSVGEEKAFQNVPEWPFWLATILGLGLFVWFLTMGCK